VEVTPVAVQLMSDGELARLEVLRVLDRDRLTVDVAGRLLNLSRLQVFRVLQAYRLEGPSGLASKKRGRPSNRTLSAGMREQALGLVRAT
jgi:hypothetical protein